LGLRLSSSSSVTLMKGEGHLPVHHHQLAVRAQVQPRPLERLEQLPWVEPDHFATRIQQRLQELPADLRGTHRVEQQAHLHTIARTFDQRITHGRAGVIGLEDVVLQIDVPLRLADGLDDGRVGGGAVHQPVHVGGAAGRQPGGGLPDPGKLGAGAVWRADCVVSAQPLAGAATAQALAHDALRAEQVVHEQADVGQRGQRQDPAQRGHRLALLQHDVAGQQQQVDHIGGGQRLAEVGETGGQRGPDVMEGFAHRAILASGGVPRPCIGQHDALHHLIHKCNIPVWIKTHRSPKATPASMTSWPSAVPVIRDFRVTRPCWRG